MASTRQKKWLESIKKNIARAACQRTSNETDIINSTTNEEEEFIVPINPNACAKKKLPLNVHEENDGSSGKREPNSSLSPQENAAIRIQACFRGHLGRRAFQALRGMVKLQALARGVYVRKQAQDATKCMQALVRLQARMRARHLRLKSEGGGAIKFLEM